MAWALMLKLKCSKRRRKPTECARGIQLGWSEPCECLAATEPGQSLRGPLSLTTASLIAAGISHWSVLLRRTVPGVPRKLPLHWNRGVTEHGTSSRLLDHHSGQRSVQGSGSAQRICTDVNIPFLIRGDMS